MASNIYTLGATSEAAAKSASRFIRDGVRKGGYSGLVQDDKSITYTTASDNLVQYPMMALDTGSKLIDITTGEQLEGVSVMYPAMSLRPPSISNPSIVFYGTTKFIAIRT